MMSGWKTWIGAIFIAASGAATALGYPEIATILLKIGGFFSIVGIGHKIEKSNIK